MDKKDISSTVKDRILQFAGTAAFGPKKIILILTVLFLILVSVMSSCTAAAITGLGGIGQAVRQQAAISLTAAEYEIVAFFREKGFADTQIAAVMGNLKQEKGDFDPTFDNGNVIGIMQWTGGQRTRLIEWCNANGYSEYTLKGQLNYAYEVYIPGSWFFPLYEGDHAYPEEYDISYEEWQKLEEEDIDLATAAFCACSEKPYYRDADGNQSELHEHRIPYAREYLQILKGGWLNGASYVTWAVSIANDPAHGYDQGNRHGPDYDCSSLVAYALRAAGYDVPIFSTYTQRGILQNIGFVQLPFDASILQPGDILWAEEHTEIYVGNNEAVGAHENENGEVVGGIPGDQTGNEISVGPMHMAFVYIYRLPAPSPTPTAAPRPERTQQAGEP